MGCSMMKTSAIDLNEEDVEFLTQNTRFQEQEIKTWYKAFQSDCPDGKLTKAKFVEIYKMFFNTGNPEKFCENVFRTFDEDGSGWINFKEFLLAIGITTGTDVQAKLKWAFKMYDINNDGRIDEAEMAKIIKISNCDRGKIALFVDAQLSDGQKGVEVVVQLSEKENGYEVEEEEEMEEEGCKKCLTHFVRLPDALYEMLGSDSDAGETGDETVDQARKVQFIFDRIDKNHDGKVSLEEFIKVCSEDHHLGKLLCAGATS